MKTCPCRLLLVGCFVWTWGSVLPGRVACAADTEGIRGKQQIHDKARLLARELLSSVLDIQLRQLRENGLDQQQVFGDIRDMRTHLDRLLNEQMEDVVDLLVKAQEGLPRERVSHFNAARDKTREVVVQLMAERQKLYRRLQIAKAAAQSLQHDSRASRSGERNAGSAPGPYTG